MLSKDQRDVLMVVDAPIDADRRVSFFVKRYGVHGRRVDIYHFLKDPLGWASPWAVVFAFCRTFLFVTAHVLPRVPDTIRRIRALLRDTPTHAYDDLHLLHFPFVTFLENIGVYFLGAMHAPKFRGYRVVHANDLVCFLFAVAAAPRGAQIVYDSHEFNPFRNRWFKPHKGRPRISWLRLMSGAAFESAAMKKADSVITVCDPIAIAFNAIYGREHVTVVENRFYQPGFRTVDVESKPDNVFDIYYFGSLAPGRGLSLLNQMALLPEVAAYALAYGGRSTNAARIRAQLPDIAIVDQEHEGALALPESHHGESLKYSWCVLEDICLSYLYALPNKFFQSLALGIPIIAAEGTYLGEIAKKTGIGIVIDATASAEEALLQLAEVDLTRYAAMQEAVHKLATYYVDNPVEAAGDRSIVPVLAA